MKIESLSLRQFRNIDELEIQFVSPVSIFVGDNGQGKSNILESIHLLLTGNSFRPSKSEHFIPFDLSDEAKKFSYLRGRIDSESSIEDVEISVTKVKNIKLNNKKVSAPKLNAHFGCILFSPESLQSVKGGPDLRRQLVDELAGSIFPQYSEVHSDFKKALKSRNRVLKEIKENDCRPSEAQKQILGILTEKYLGLASEVTFLRLTSLKEVESLFLESFRDISGLNNVDSSVEYVISDERIFDFDKNQLLNLMSQRLDELSGVEMRTGVTLVGPHKHDIRFIFNAENARYYASQGQQRALIIAFKMAQMMYHKRLFNRRPILLLDDVFSELDQSKRRYLVETLRRSEAQTILTSTDFEDAKYFEEDTLSMFEICSGKIEKKGTR